jgi:hypothetical protein
MRYIKEVVRVVKVFVTAEHWVTSDVMTCTLCGHVDIVRAITHP